MSESLWLRHRRARPDAAARLFCLPYAGGSALAYRSWAALAPAELEICPIQLPGRENRAEEAPFRRMDALVAALADAIAPWLDLPYGLFGHSMGARVAFELARQLRDRGAPAPCHLFASGSRAPQVPANAADVHTRPDEVLVADLREMGGTPDEVLADDFMRAALLKLVRADFEVLETYRFDGRDSLACDIAAFRGAADPYATREGVDAWASLTKGRFTHRLFPGGHFFLAANARAIVSDVGVRMFRSVERADA